FQPHVDCGTPVTLSVDGQTARPLRPFHGVDFAAGDLKTGAIYLAVYNAGNAEWIVQGFAGGFLSTGNFGTVNPDLAAIEALAGTTGALRKTAANTWVLDEGDNAIIFEKDAGGSVLPTGILGDAQATFACTILSATMLADQTGSAVLDIWKAAY